MTKEYSLTEGFEMLITEMKKEQKQSAVSVQDKEGNELAPCTHKRARILLERGQATIVRYVPFAIRLTKETGDFVDAELELHKGAVHVCFSNVGQNRTEFMLTQAIRLAKQAKKVVFVSRIVHEHILNALVSQGNPDDEIDFLEYLHVSSIPDFTNQTMEELIHQFEPDIFIVDEWNEEFTPRKFAKETDTAIWYGLSTKKKLEQMPCLAHLRPHVSEQDAAFIIALYGNQANVLKNRFGPNGEKATHQKNLRFALK